MAPLVLGSVWMIRTLYIRRGKYVHGTGCKISSNSSRREALLPVGTFDGFSSAS